MDIMQVKATKMLASRVIARQAVPVRGFSSMLRATEMFTPVVKSTPKASAPIVLKESKTSNGIRVISCDNGAAAVNINIAVLGGSRACSVNETGFAHVLASTAFSGTHHQTGLRLMRTLENAGAKVSANACREAITYSLSCTDNVADACMKEMGDVVCNPVHADKSYYIADALGAAQVGAKSHHDNASCQLDDLLHDVSFGSHTPLGSSIFDTNAGTAEKVSAIMDYRTRTFTASNTIITGSGISHDTLKSIVDTHFGAMKTGTATAAIASPFIGGEAKIRCDLGGCSHIGIAFATSIADSAAFTVLAKKLSANAAKGVTVFHHQYRDQGLFGFKVHGSSSTVASALLESAITSLKNASVHEGDVKRALLDDASLISSAISGVAANTKVSVSQASGAAKVALGSKFAYAVYGATSGTASHSDVAAMLK